eukprot:TRINITY_DN21331_c0_g4_i1.p1 TRINITY_DN21331_c0_g4~~TRINITY_DN21331_c0_g4_i1.p1  ORF type:complete len:105 (-),score=0.51 TRINITY_DN21331_c0_g4_i1:121-435(-)
MLHPGSSPAVVVPSLPRPHRLSMLCPAHQFEPRGRLLGATLMGHTIPCSSHRNAPKLTAFLVYITRTLTWVVHQRFGAIQQRFGVVHQALGHLSPVTKENTKKH